MHELVADFQLVLSTQLGGRWSSAHQFAEVVDRVTEQGAYTQVVSALQSLLGFHVRVWIDASKVEQRVLVVRRIIRLGLASNGMVTTVVTEMSIYLP